MRGLTNALRRAWIVQKGHLNIIQRNTSSKELLTLVCFVVVLMCDPFSLKQSKTPVAPIHIAKRVGTSQMCLESGALIERSQSNRVPINARQVLKDCIMRSTNVANSNKASAELQATGMTFPLRDKHVR